VKVLDFGLARVDERSGADLSQSPTLTIGGTGGGVLLGTAAYMSPEQARGQIVDKRTDIWAFGCVLYEMLTGRAAFSGETLSDHLAAILDREPDWAALPLSTPAAVGRLLRRCLEKDPRRRLHDVADVRIEIDDAMTTPPLPPAPPRDARGWRHAALMLMSGVVAGAALVGVLTRALNPRGTTPQPYGTTRSLISLHGANFESLALSPDGPTLAFIGTKNGRSQLYVRPLDRADAVPMDGTLDAAYAFFSPDGRWIGFNVRGQLKKIAVTGGAPQRIGNPYVGAFRGAAWMEDGTIVYARYSDLWRMSVDDGSQRLVAAPTTSRREKAFRWPDVLPGGKSVLLTVSTADTDSWDDARIEVLSLESGQPRVLIEGGTCARYVRSGHLVYARKGKLLAVPFSLDRLQVLGPPVVVLENVFVDRGNGYGGFAIASNGSIMFASSPEKTSGNQLWWVDRTGKDEFAANAAARKGRQNSRAGHCHVGGGDR
jgi:protein kinase-like protein/WD40 repeat protein